MSQKIREFLELEEAARKLRNVENAWEKLQLLGKALDSPPGMVPRELVENEVWLKLLELRNLEELKRLIVHAPHNPREAIFEELALLREHLQARSGVSEGFKGRSAPRQRLRPESPQGPPAMGPRQNAGRQRGPGPVRPVPARMPPRRLRG